MSDASVSPSGTGHAISGGQPPSLLSNKGYNALATAAVILGIALFVIVEVLGTYGILSGQEGAFVVGGTLIGVGLLRGAVSIYRIRKGAFPLDHKDTKVAYLTDGLMMTASIALGILGMTGSLSISTTGIGAIVAFSAIGLGYLFYSDLRHAHRGEMIKNMITLALFIINVLGATGVITGEAGRIAIGITNIGAISAYTIVKYLNNPQQPFLKSEIVGFLATIVIGVLGCQGVLSTPLLLGTTALVTASGATQLFSIEVEHELAKMREGQPLDQT